MLHFYAFRTKDHLKFPIYERTFGCEKAAKRWADDKPNRFYTSVVPDRFYY